MADLKANSSQLERSLNDIVSAWVLQNPADALHHLVRPDSRPSTGSISTHSSSSESDVLYPRSKPPSATSARLKLNGEYGRTRIYRDKRLRVTKMPKMCHLCNARFGGNGICIVCEHRYCGQCELSPSGMILEHKTENSFNKLPPESTSEAASARQSKLPMNDYPFENYETGSNQFRARDQYHLEVPTLKPLGESSPAAKNSLQILGLQFLDSFSRAGKSEWALEDNLDGQTYFVAQAKSRLIDDLMGELSNFILSVSLSNIRTHGTNSGNSSSCENGAASHNASWPLRSSANSATSVHAGKRRADDQDFFSDDDDGGRRKKPVRSQPLSYKPRLFACPFHKHSQKTYSSSNDAPEMAQKFRVCGGPGWPTIPRLKEHLYRVHRAPIHCTRCWISMTTELELQQHTRAEIPCSVQPPVLQWVSRDKLDLLKDRKRTASCQTEEERWNDIFRLLFPEESNPPSPYYDDLDQIISDKIQQSPSSNNFAAFERYSQENLPRRVRAELERLVDEQMQPIKESIRCALTDVVRNCQEQIFKEWAQHTSKSLMESGLVQSRVAFDFARVGAQMASEGVPPAYCIEPAPMPDNSQFAPVYEPPKAREHSSTAGADLGYETLATQSQSWSYDIPVPVVGENRVPMPFGNEESEGFDFGDSAWRLLNLTGTEVVDWSNFFGEENDDA